MGVSPALHADVGSAGARQIHGHGERRAPVEGAGGCVSVVAGGDGRMIDANPYRVYASVNWTTTLISSLLLSRALVKFSGRSLLVISRSSHERSVLANASLALYQCRLLALTLPTTTLFLKTTSAAISPAVGAPMLWSPRPIP
jgi:hypothetical protein